MQTLALRHLDVCLVALLVMPRSIGLTRFHCRKDMYQARLPTPFFDDGFDPGFLAKRFVFANEFYLNPVFISHRLRVLPDRIP